MEARASWCGSADVAGGRLGCYFGNTVAKTSTTTLKIPESLKARVAAIAKQSGRAPHAVMVDALERQIAREEAMASFVQEAIDSDRAVDDGDAVFRAEDVNAGLERLARGETVRDPKPWRR